MAQESSLLEKCNDWLREKSGEIHYKLSTCQDNTDDYLLPTVYASVFAVGVAAAVEPQLLVDTYRMAADTVPETVDQFMIDNRIPSPDTIVDGLEQALENNPEKERSIVNQTLTFGLPGGMAAFSLGPLGRSIRYGVEKGSGAIHDYLR